MKLVQRRIGPTAPEWLIQALWRHKPYLDGTKLGRCRLSAGSAEHHDQHNFFARWWN